MADVYGDVVAQGMDDPPWIEDATRKGQVILTKDYKSLRYRAPLETIKIVGARVFALESAGLPGSVQLAYFRTNMQRIVRASRRPGPYIYKVREHGVHKAWP